MEKESLKTIYRDGDLLLGESGGNYYLSAGERLYQLSDYPYEPCLYIKGAHGYFITIHHSFTLNELRLTARENGSIRMITGDEYDMHGVCMLLRRALSLSLRSVDIAYLEGCCFMDLLAEQGAVSRETAIALSSAGIENPNVMESFLHAKKVFRTNEAKYYLPVPGKKDRDKEDRRNYYSRVISNQVRFGYGYRTYLSEKQYFAWHGYPNRNDDYITYAEISGKEFDRIGEEYPKDLDADRETAEIFRKKYVDGHKILAEGWNVILPAETETV